MADPTLLGLRDVAAALRAGTITPVDLLDAARGRAHDLDADLGCLRWAALDPPLPTGALTASPLWGVPGLLKANICRRDWPVDCASRILAGWRPPYDAHAVTRLDAVGAVLWGLTNCDEFGMGSSTEFAWGPTTRNPWNPDRVAGGSSGGSAAAVAAGLAWFALGSDTGGSVRQPAHCCGVVGLKPTYGRVSRTGLVAHASSLDVIGPMARSVDDCADVFAAIAGRDPRDATSWDPATTAPRAAADLVVGVVDHLDDTTVAPDQRRDLVRVADDLTAAGTVLRPVTLPSTDRALAAYAVIAAAETSANLARYDGTHIGPRPVVAAPTHAAMARTARTIGFGREVKLRVLAGAHILSAGAGEDLHRAALAERERQRSGYRRLFDDVDVLLLPTCDDAAFPRGERVDDPVRMRAADRWTVPASLAGLPALTLPTGLDREGLPLSCQLVGPHGTEDLLFEVGRVIEAARGFRTFMEVGS